MGVLEPRELRESPLADLHALASELGIEGYRRLRREELIAAISESGGEAVDAAAAAAADAPAGEAAEAVGAPAGESDETAAAERPGRPRRGRGPRPARDEPREEEPAEEERSGTLDVLPNGSGFLRADPFAHSPEDVYVSPSQVRRCELRTGDEVTGRVRGPRRSERYPSLVRVERVNDAPAEPPAERPRFADLTPAFARERLSAPDELDAIRFGKGSRVAVTGSSGAGSTTVLRRIATTLRERHPDLDLVVALAGARPEEIAEWRSAVEAPVVGGSFDQSPERQGEIASMAVERAKRAAERGAHAAVVIDSLEHLPPAAARRVFGAARNTEEAGSVTVIAATGDGPEAARHATTRVVLQPAGAGDGPAVDTDASVTLRAELLS